MKQLKLDVDAEDITIPQFAAMLEGRLINRLNEQPCDPMISSLALCNVDRRADITSIYVINEILNKFQGTEMLLHLAIMRAGPNSYENYVKFIDAIDGDYSYEGLCANLPNYDGAWLRNYRRPLMTAQNRAVSLTNEPSLLCH